MVRVIPVSDDKVAALLKSGRDAKELAEEWGVQPQTVRKAANAAGWRPGNSNLTLLPFRLSGPRTFAPAARNLRRLERLKQEGDLPEEDRVRLKNWRAERDKTGTVVEYREDEPPNPASPTHGGWYYAKRRPDTPDDVYYQEVTGR
jgi:hypothetical protein